MTVLWLECMLASKDTKQIRLKKKGKHTYFMGQVGIIVSRYVAPRWRWYRNTAILRRYIGRQSSAMHCDVDWWRKRLKAGEMCSIPVSVSQNLTREIRYNKVHGVLAWVPLKHTTTHGARQCLRGSVEQRAAIYIFHLGLYWSYVSGYATWWRPLK